jgi:hypothetical protein
MRSGSWANKDELVIFASCGAVLLLLVVVVVTLAAITAATAVAAAVPVGAVPAESFMVAIEGGRIYKTLQRR